MEEYRKYKQNYNKKTNYSNYNYNNVEYYKKTEQKTISYTSNENNSRIKHYTSLTNKNNYHIPDRSKREKSNSSLGKSLNNSSSSNTECPAPKSATPGIPEIKVFSTQVLIR